MTRHQRYWLPFLHGMATVYLLVAITTATVMGHAMPAMNILGITYVGATWPIGMFCAASQIPGCTVFPPAGSALANVLFTFD